MIALIEIEDVGLEKDVTEVTLELMTAAVVDPKHIQTQDQDPCTDLALELVQLETILPIIVQIHERVQ